MSSNKRHAEIIKLLQDRGECSVEFLTERLDVSGMTIRRDLQLLADAGKVIRTHGGALLGPQISFEFQFLTRLDQHKQAKRAIAAKAMELIDAYKNEKNGRTIMLDSGSTTLLVAQQLANRNNLRVITTSLPIAAALQYSEGIEVVMLGGVLRRGSPDLVGPLTEANLETLRADMVFVGADAVDAEGYVYNASMEVGRMLSRMAACSKRVFVLADSSKLNATATMRFGKLKHFQGLITDKHVEKSFVHKMKKQGVQVLLADE